MADALLVKRNDALNVNTMRQNNQSVAIHQTVRGSDWYYTVCAVVSRHPPYSHPSPVHWLRLEFRHDTTRHDHEVIPSSSSLKQSINS